MVLVGDGLAARGAGESFRQWTVCGIEPMSPIEICVCDSDEAVAHAAATRWLEVLRAAPSLIRCAALSGGRSASGLFNAITSLAQPVSKPGILSGVHFFWADERCVPPGDDQGNFRQADELLLRPMGIPAKRIHRIKGEAPPAEAAREAGLDLLNTTHARYNGIPILDLVFLGVGEDGHIASIFPDAPGAVLQGPKLYSAVTAPKPPSQRITLTLPVLATAREVWVLACGPGKSGIIDQSLGEGSRTPLAQLLALRANTVIFRKQ